MLELSSFYNTPYHILEHYGTGKLYKMFSYMWESRAKARIRDLEIACFPHWKESQQDKFLKSLYSKAGEKYTKGRQMTEEDLKGMFNNV